MSTTSIEWTDRVWNPVRGCARVSEGCRHCYAERVAARFSDPGKPFERYAYRTRVRGVGEARWTGRVELIPDKLDEPLSWRKPSRVFVNSMSDLFHESLTDGEILRVFLVMARAPRHTFQVLTKRPERMRDWMTKWMDLAGESGDPLLVRGPEATRRAHPSCRGQMFASLLESLGEPPPGAAFPTFDWMEGLRWWARAPFGNVWLGVSVEDQKTADERIPLLLQTPAAVRFVSYEPALGPVNFTGAIGWGSGWCPEHDFAGGFCIGSPCASQRQRLDWVIVGGESGPGARPCDVAWIRDVVRQCKEAETPVFVKQLGARPIGEPWASNRRFSPLVYNRKGGDPSEWPADLRVREFPR